jgi:hypothetical protein
MKSTACPMNKDKQWPCLNEGCNHVLKSEKTLKTHMKHNCQFASSDQIVTSKSPIKRTRTEIFNDQPINSEEQRIARERWQDAREGEEKTIDVIDPT